MAHIRVTEETTLSGRMARGGAGVLQLGRQEGRAVHQDQRRPPLNPSA
jgi:hypothetical protein